MKMIGKTTSSQDLFMIAQKNNIDLTLPNIMTKDMLVHTPITNKMNLVLNLESYDNNFEGGTHWVALYKNKNDVYYFDSFGGKPPNIVMQLFSKVHYNSYQVQELRSNNCGLYCMMFLKAMKEGVDYESFINYFDESGNDAKINI